MSTENKSIPDWDYSNTKGPANWASLCPEFQLAADYKYQSPIAISNDSVITNQNLDDLKFSYVEQNFVTDFFTHSIHLVPDTFASKLTVNHLTYELQDIHIHMPNEHVINGTIQPLEIHYVHRTPDNQILVLAIFVKASKTATALPNINWQSKQINVFNPASLLPTSLHFYTYSGSLTTPPTSGPVTWILLAEAQKAQPSWLDGIKRSLPQNNIRPLQPLNGRTVEFH